MNIILKRADNVELPISMLDWIFYLNFADWYGWKPQGTLPPVDCEDDTWDGRYDSKEGQLVSSGDSKALSAALNRAINDRNYEHRVEDVYLPLRSDLGEELSIDPMESFDPWQILEQIKTFISFANGNDIRLMKEG